MFENCANDFIIKDDLNGEFLCQSSIGEMKVKKRRFLGGVVCGKLGID